MKAALHRTSQRRRSVARKRSRRAQPEGERQGLQGVLPHDHGLEREGGRERHDERPEPRPGDAADGPPLRRAGGAPQPAEGQNREQAGHEGRKSKGVRVLSQPDQRTQHPVVERRMGEAAGHGAGHFRRGRRDQLVVEALVRVEPVVGGPEPKPEEEPQDERQEDADCEQGGASRHGSGHPSRLRRAGSRTRPPAGADLLREDQDRQREEVEQETGEGGGEVPVHVVRRHDEDAEVGGEDRQRRGAPEEGDVA